MKTGRLHVLLGAAPGAGTTSRMLDEGRRLRADGTDVVVAFVETYGRGATVEVGDLEVIPGNLAAVLARRPETALVDGLAHRNAPGSAHERRWQDAQTLLEAGIDVLCTVDVQCIESLDDAVQRITGIPQQETVPDAVLRGADRIELVDLDPQAPLRQVALRWLADARDRVVVALTGGPEGETLLRRSARIAQRSSAGELLAVHVTSQGGPRAARPELLAQQRLLVESLGGSYHQVVGEDVPKAIVEFARSVDAAKLVIGVSRRGRLAAALTGPGVGATVVRESGDIDVQIVDHESAGRSLTLPRLGGSLSPRRRILGLALALIGGPALTWFLSSLRSAESITSEVLAYQLLVVLVALLGGIGPALFAAILSGLTLDFFFVDPRLSISVGEPLHLVALVLYVVNAILVSAVVDRAARRSRAAERAAAESELLATIAGGVIRGQGAVQSILERTREAFGLTGVRLVRDGRLLGSDGEPGGGSESVPVGSGAVLELHGAPLASGERRLLAVVAAQLGAAVQHEDLSETASELAPLAATDRVRSALLSAVSHDLRRPLAAATAAVGGLRAADIALSEADTALLLATAQDSLATLAALVTNLLDVTRLQAGVLAVTVAPADAADAILPAIDELHLGPAELDLDLDLDVPEVLADTGLLQRVVVNLLANAARYSPPGQRIRLSTSGSAGTVQIRIADHGPGIAAERRDDVFVPFQRLGDTDNTAGLGLGLALSRGFTEGMGGSLKVEDTPGGGLTMVITLPTAV